jgi:hypothetical protein
MLVGIDAVNVRAAYQPVAQACSSQWIHGVCMKMHRVSANYRGENLFYPRKIPLALELTQLRFHRRLWPVFKTIKRTSEEVGFPQSYTYDKNNGSCNSTLPYSFILCKETTSPLHTAVSPSINFALSL